MDEKTRNLVQALVRQRDHYANQAAQLEAELLTLRAQHEANLAAATVKPAPNGHIEARPS
jgi:hypothetical protein